MESKWFQTTLFGDNLVDARCHGPLNVVAWPLSTAFGSALPGVINLLRNSPKIPVFLFYGVGDWMAAPRPAVWALDNHLEGVSKLQWRLGSWEDMDDANGRVKVAGEGLMFADFHRASRLVASDQGNDLLNSLSRWLTKHHNEQSLSQQPESKYDKITRVEALK